MIGYRYRLTLNIFIPDLVGVHFYVASTSNQVANT